MKTPPTLPFKKLLSASLILTLFGMSAGCTVASPGYGNQPIYQAMMAIKTPTIIVPNNSYVKTYAAKAIS